MVLKLIWAVRQVESPIVLMLQQQMPSLLHVGSSEE